MGKKHGQTCHRRYAQKTNVASDMAKKMQPTHAKRKTWWRVRKNMHQLRRRENAIDDMRRKKYQVTSTKMYNRWQNLENVFDSFTFTSPLAPSWRIGSQGWEKNLYHFYPSVGWSQENIALPNLYFLCVLSDSLTTLKNGLPGARDLFHPLVIDDLDDICNLLLNVFRNRTESMAQEW